VFFFFQTTFGVVSKNVHPQPEKEVYDTLPEKEDEEDDMLDLAFEVTETSRLGCQIPVIEEYAGIKVRIPDDGFSA